MPRCRAGSSVRPAASLGQGRRPVGTPSAPSVAQPPWGREGATTSTAGKEAAVGDCRLHHELAWVGARGERRKEGGECPTVTIFAVARASGIRLWWRCSRGEGAGGSDSGGGVAPMPPVRGDAGSHNVIHMVVFGYRGKVEGKEFNTNRSKQAFLVGPYGSAEILFLIK